MANQWFPKRNDLHMVELCISILVYWRRRSTYADDCLRQPQTLNGAWVFTCFNLQKPWVWVALLFPWLRQRCFGAVSNVITGLTSRLSLLIIAGHSLRPNWRYLFEGNPLINHPSSINPGLTLRWSSRLDPSQTVKPWFWHGKMTRRTLNERRSSKPMSRQCSSERRAAPSRACQNMSEEVFLRSFQNTLVLVDDFRGLYWVVLIPNPSQYGIKRD